MAGKLVFARPKNQLLRWARCPCANQCSLALEAREDLLPDVVAHVLECQRQRLVKIDSFVEQIDRALRFPPLQPLRTEAEAERQYLESAKVATTARDHQLHRTEMHIRLDAIKRHVPQIRRATSRASGHRGDCLLVALLQLAQSAVRI